jgi:hypothetical protein
LHQVPIHIYPGMETAPLSSPSSTFQQGHGHTLSQPPTDFSVHLSPIQDPPISNADPFGTTAMNTPLSKPPSLSTILDLSALDATRVPSLHSEESGQDEQIDFDALWAWPSNTPAMGSPRQPGMERVQGISDSSVPMFGLDRSGRDT